MMSFKYDVCSLDLGCAEPNSAQVPDYEMVEIRDGRKVLQWAAQML